MDAKNCTISFFGGSAPKPPYKGDPLLPYQFTIHGINFLKNIHIPNTKVLSIILRNFNFANITSFKLFYDFEFFGGLSLRLRHMLLYMKSSNQNMLNFVWNQSKVVPKKFEIFRMCCVLNSHLQRKCGCCKITSLSIIKTPHFLLKFSIFIFKVMFLITFLCNNRIIQILGIYLCFPNKQCIKNTTTIFIGIK
jgi:hypothetical protein